MQFTDREKKDLHQNGILPFLMGSLRSLENTAKSSEIELGAPLDEGPFMAVKVGCGVTFTFGGLAVDPKTSGLISDLNGKVIPASSVLVRWWEVCSTRIIQAGVD